MLQINLTKSGKFSRLLVLVTAIAIFSACSGVKKMQKDVTKLQYKATPEVLVTKGGKIHVNINGTFPEKYFNKKAKMEITPVLKYESGNTTLAAIMLKGEKAEGDGEVIKYSGGSFTKDYTIDYQPAMNVSRLVINPKIIYKEKAIELSELKIADGVIITETRVDNEAAEVEIAMHEYEKQSVTNKTADIYFPYSKFNYDKNLKLNKQKESQDRINELKNFLKMNWAIQNIDINAWASPEGEDKYNENLSKDRANTTLKIMKDYISAYEKETDNANKKAYNKLSKKERAGKKYTPFKMQEVTYNIQAMGEDKEGFVNAVKASNLKDKNAIINVIENEKSKFEREKKIKDMTVIYGDVESLLEPLRRGEISAKFLEPKRNDEQILSLATSNPDSLNIKELLYAGVLTNDLNTKYQIYKSATTIYADDWRGYNNAGYTAFKLEKFDEAGSYFEKANTLSPNNGVVLNNLGAVALAKNNFASAKQYYESANSYGVNTDYNLGIVLLTEGNYEEAVKNFESKKCSYNLALAQLLLDNTAGAQSTLDCAEKNAEIYYLMAIIGARTQNTQMMVENLGKSISMDPKYKEEAKNDREFLKYFDNPEFKQLTQ